MNCPKCNTEIEDGILFCGECGTKIEYDKKCPKCGTSIKEEAMFCPECGASACAASDVMSTETTEKAVAESIVENSDDTSNMQVEFAKDASDTPNVKTAIKSKEDIEEELDKTMAIPIIRNVPPKPNPASAPVRPMGVAGTPMSKPVNPNPTMPRSAAPHPVASHPVVPRPVAPAPQPMRDPNYGYRPSPAPAPLVNSPAAYAKKEAPVAAPVKSAEKKKDSGQTQKNILIFLIVFLLVILIGLGCVFAVMYFGGKDADNVKESSSQNDTKKEDNTEDSSENDKETEDEDDKPKPGEEGKSTSPEEYSINIDLDYEFDEGVELDEETYSIDEDKLTSKKMEKYDLVYGVPENFQSESGNKNRYVETQNTAYMNVVAKKNKEGFLLEDVMNETIGEFDEGVVIKSADRESFHIEVEDKGLIYIQRCYVTEDYIRYFEFVYPEEYSYVYDDYFFVIDNAFVCE